MQPRFTPGVICGLGETEITQDIELIKPLINNKISKIRAAAYYSISLLGHKDLNMFVQGLQDSNNKVRNISVFVLKPYRLDVQKKLSSY
ncbi:MAG: hypothetical protein HRU35_05890 [Rickettsiaceae bacterium]|nr:hypothetical protein [Rickettsiaceae bacterium]